MNKDFEKVEISELEIIKAEVEQAFKIKNIAKKNRNPQLVIARACYYDLAKKKTSFSNNIIGSLVGTDNPTLINAIRTLPSSLKKYPQFKRVYDNLNGKDIPVEYSDLHRKLLKTENKLKDLEQKLKLLKRGDISNHHKSLYDLIDKIPPYHVETVRVRLDPIIKMLEKPSRYNNYLNVESYA